jgi:hypothetical protein
MSGLLQKLKLEDLSIGFAMEYRPSPRGEG